MFGKLLKTALAALAGGTLPFLITAQSAVADQDISKYLTSGKKYYATKDYKVAYQYFKAGLSASPKNLECAYYLANVCLQLRQYNEANSLYQTCLTEQPDAMMEKNIKAACEYCNKMISAATSPSATKASASPTTGTTGTTSTTQSDNSTSAEKSTHDIEIEKHKQRIMDEANRKCEEIRKQSEEQMEEARLNSTYMDYSGNKMLYPPSVKDQMVADMNEKILQVKEQARREANNVR